MPPALCQGSSLTTLVSIEWRFENVLGSEERMRELLEASLIHIDINHHGDIEDAILQAGEG